MTRYHRSTTNPRRWYVSTKNDERRKLKRDGWEVIAYEKVPNQIRSDKRPGTWQLEPSKGMNALYGNYRYEGLTYQNLPSGQPMT